MWYPEDVCTRLNINTLNMSYILQDATIGFTHHSSIDYLDNLRVKLDVDVLRACVFGVTHIHSSTEIN